MAEAGTVERREDVGDSPVDRARYWSMQIDLSKKHFREWQERGQKVVDRYRAEEGSNQGGFNMLFSTVETLKPSLWSRVPKPDVRRRWNEMGALERETARVVERALSYSLDVYDFSSPMERARDDALLPGRGVVRVVYDPDVRAVEGEAGEAGEEGEQDPSTGGEEAIVGQAIWAEHVGWKDYLEEPAACWADVSWVAYADKFTRDQLADEFGEIGNEVPLLWAPDSTDAKTEEGRSLQRARVWQIWDKVKRERIWLAEGFDRILRTDADPYKLAAFFPQPEPFTPHSTTDSRIPIPDYTIWQDLASEVDRITKRLDKLIDAVKARGFTDKELADQIKTLSNAPDNEIIGLENFAELAANGTLDKMIVWQPIEAIVRAIAVLYQQRDAAKQTIFEVTGMSDILRGASDPGETFGAQRIKAQFGSLRLNSRRDAMQKFARDVLRIKAEIICEHFTPEMLAEQTGIQLPTPEERDQAKAAIEKARQGEVESAVSDELRTLAKQPTWPEVMEILRSDNRRSIVVDIETDSTVQADAAEEQKQRTEFVTAVTGFLAQAMPAVKSGLMRPELAQEMLVFGARAFKTGRALEDAIETFGVTSGEHPAIAEAKQQMGQLQQQLQQAEMEKGNEAAKEQTRQQEADQSHQIAMKRLDVDREKAMADAEAKAGDREIRNKELALKAMEKGLDPGTFRTPEEVMQHEGEMKELAAAILAMSQAMQQQNALLSESVRLASAPKELITDAQGNPVGVRTVQPTMQ